MITPGAIRDLQCLCEIFTPQKFRKLDRRFLRFTEKRRNIDMNKTDFRLKPVSRQAIEKVQEKGTCEQ